MDAPPLGKRLTEEYPSVFVLIIDDGSGCVFSYELRPYLVEMGVVAPSGIVSAIRRVAHAARLKDNY
jgi:hypothetical protein